MFVAGASRLRRFLSFAVLRSTPLIVLVLVVVLVLRDLICPAFALSRGSTGDGAEPNYFRFLLPFGDEVSPLIVQKTARRIVWKVRHFSSHRCSLLSLR